MTASSGPSAPRGSSVGDSGERSSFRPDRPTCNSRDDRAQAVHSYPSATDMLGADLSATDRRDEVTVIESIMRTGEDVQNVKGALGTKSPKTVNNVLT